MNQFTQMLLTGGWFTSGLLGRHILQIGGGLECVLGHIIFVMDLELLSGNFCCLAGWLLAWFFVFDRSGLPSKQAIHGRFSKPVPGSTSYFLKRRKN